MPNERYDDLACFVAVADHGSLVRAGEAVGRSASQVSRVLTRLEERLGVKLAHRTTRRVTLTEEGRALHDRAKAAFSDLDEAEAAVGQVLGVARGRLRVSLPVLYGHRFVAPLAARFAVEHPQITVELVFEDRKVDLVEEGYDLAVRIGLADDPALVARRLGSTTVRTVASPAYLASAPPLDTPDDLANHQVLLHTSEATSRTWRLPGPDGDREVALPAGRFVATSGFALCDAALAGLGVARVPAFMIDEAIARGDLVTRLQPWDRVLAIAAVYPPGRHLAPKVRRFVDFIAGQCRDAPRTA